MRLKVCRYGSFLACTVAVVLVAGCVRSDRANKAKSGQVAAVQPVHDHSGWWCDEHGVPEEECSMCSDKVAAEFKKKGDWCEKHERAKSQCFICDPSLEAKYAAKYEAKYGKKPPMPTENQAK